jgi:hypothetical protein
MCERARSPNPYWTVARTDMERLLGVLAGIGADHRVNETELALLRTLMAASSHLAGTWPYDEIDSVLKGVLADRRIDDDEHRFLVAFTRSFLDAVPEAAAGPSIDEEFVRRGACAVKPRIEFAGRRFCVTGTSPAATRVEIERTVSRLGGALVPDVAVDLDYLVVDAGRNVSWAFSCHGRKVEEALLLRREGVPLTIVHADDVRAAARA